jgi:enamine deaminase RidA (YjgF/YER057c/UK114 family)
VSASPRPIHPDGWLRGTGYSHGVEARGRIVCTAGQIGWDPLTRKLVGADFAAQAGQALANVAAVLRTAGAWPEHLVRMTWYITDRKEYLDAQHAVGASYRALFGRHFPAMSVVVVSALLEVGALVEIEATAVVPE